MSAKTADNSIHQIQQNETSNYDYASLISKTGSTNRSNNAYFQKCNYYSNNTNNSYDVVVCQEMMSADDNQELENKTKSISNQDNNNIDFNFLIYLNDELVNLGFDSIYYSSNRKSNVNYNLLFKNTIDLIERYNRQLLELDRVKEQCYKLDRENELLVKRNQSLKDSFELTNREMASLEEKCRQLQLKCNSINKSLKESTEENRKLQNTIEQRDKQFKHDKKKQEKEIDKLKERVQVLTTAKTKELPHLDLSDTLNRRTNGPRALWNTDGSKKQIELYTELIKDYDRKTKELIIENTDLRSFLSNVYLDLAKCSSQIDDNKLASYDETPNQKHFNIENSLNEDNELSSSTEETDYDREVSDEIAKLPIENIHSKLKKEFQDKFQLIKKKNVDLIENSMKTNSNKNFSNTNMNINQNNMSLNNLTLSSIDTNSTTLTKISNKYEKLNEDDLLNKTFTVVGNKNDAFTNLNKIFLNESNELSGKQAKGGSKKLNENTEETILKSQLELLNNELNECKKIIETQSEFINNFGDTKNLSKIVSSTTKASISPNTQSSSSPTFSSSSSSSSTSSSSGSGSFVKYVNPEKSLTCSLINSSTNCTKTRNNFSHLQNENDQSKLLMIKHTSTPNELNEKESHLIIEEKSRLAKEKKLLLEQKLKLEQETNIFRKISTELAKQKKEFQDEQENFYQSKLLSSFLDHESNQNLSLNVNSKK